MHQFKITSLLGALVVLATQLAPASGRCCGGKAVSPVAEPCGVQVKTECHDGTCGTPCCGVGKCNIFCCACNGNCRGDRDSGLQTQFDFEALRGAAQADEDDYDVCSTEFNKADANSDGMITFAEWAVHTLDAETLEPLVARWLQFDTEGKGFLTQVEAVERKA